LTAVEMIWSSTKKNIAARNTMTNTMPVEMAVSRRLGQVTLDTSRRTSLMNCPGLTLAIPLSVSTPRPEGRRASGPRAGPDRGLAAPVSLRAS
jgi:hypothetical protein